MTDEVKPMKPPFSYYGGKQKFSSKIIPLIPKHTVYAEPFCGSAAVFFKKPFPSVKDRGNYREAINDTNEWLVNFFRV
ncbi:MAG: DNA adenine methylase, partial [Candidatus Bathyarchaeia archaeon]